MIFAKRFGLFALVGIALIIGSGVGNAEDVCRLH